MVSNNKLEEYLNSLMNIELFEDYVPNGLQIEGCLNIKKIITSASLTQGVIQEAISQKAQAILVHHGLFWKNDPRVLRGVYREKIRNILFNEINLLAYHLPMDFLPGLGNNEPVLKSLGATKVKPFAQIGYTGNLKKEIRCEDFFKKLNSFYDTKGTHIPKKGSVQKIAIVSGNGTSYFQKAIEEGIDAFITGEGTEWVYQLSMDNNVAYSAMGHYTSECIGPKLLGKHLEKKFNIECTMFVENNPF